MMTIWVLKSEAIPLAVGLIICDLFVTIGWVGMVLKGMLPVKKIFFLCFYITDEKKKKTYHDLNAFGLTPWIALHLIYVVILSFYAWLNNSGYAADALAVCEALFNQFSWLVLLCEALMLPVFIYWSYIQISGNTVFKKGMDHKVRMVAVRALFAGGSKGTPEKDCVAG